MNKYSSGKDVENPFFLYVFWKYLNLYFFFLLRSNQDFMVGFFLNGTLDDIVYWASLQRQVEIELPSLSAEAGTCAWSVE